MLNFALREVLGGHVDQKGSIFLPEKLRFDFSHGKPVRPEDLRKNESIVNQQIKDKLEVFAREIKLADAKHINGLRAVFGELMEYGNCSNAARTAFSKNITGQTRRVNALLIVDTILMGVMVGIGAYVQRYRHHPLTRFLFLGATVLFIPIVSNVVSSIDNQFMISILYDGKEIITGICQTNLPIVFIWVGLVQIVGISTSAIVATDAKEGRNTAPSVLLLVEAIWTVYLVVYITGTDQNRRGTRFSWEQFFESFDVITGLGLLVPFALIFAKLIFKIYAFYIARRTFALGRNPRLIVGYMEQWERSQHAEAELIGEHIPPPLVVMGEETVQVDKQPHGLCFKWMFDQVDRTRMNNNGLVTLDKVWRLDDNLLRSMPLKDVCISFASFKLLRCRFAKYTAAEVNFMKVHNFFWQVLLKDSDDERVLGVIADELSFLHDYYYSSLPISYSMCWLPILGIFISLLSIVYCLFTTTVIVVTLLRYGGGMQKQISCKVKCDPYPEGYVNHASWLDNSSGCLMFDIVPVLLLLSLIVLAEARDIAYYICSNWTKVSLICGYVNNASWQQSPTMRKWVGRVLHCRCKLVKPWKDKMNQCSILVLHPRKTPMALLRRLISLPEQKKNVKVPRAVKAAIIDVLRRSEGCLRNNLTSLCQSVHIGDNLLWACNGKGTTDTLLVWHIATGIFEVRHPHSSTSNHKIAATHLSRYCAYLMTYSPELLPDYDEWSKSLYKAVKKDAEGVLAGRVAVSTPEAEYQQLVELLSAKSKHEVLTNGARLGRQLVDEMEDEETTWRFLAGFWSKIILYVAPSDNLDGHAEAIARGGELITLLWALLTHIGIVSRPDSAAAATAGDPAFV